MAGYKSKTIKAILTKKIDKWIASIEDTDLQAAVKRDTIVTGGAIASMLQGEEVNDFDIYFKTYSTTLRVAEYYVARFKDSKKEGLDFNLYVDGDFRYANGGTIGDGSKRVKIIAKSAGVAGEETESGEYKYFEMHPSEEAQEYISKVMDNPSEIEDTFEDTRMELVKETEGKFRPVFLSSNAITLSDKIQIVLRFYGNPDEIHANYDYVHCTSYWEAGTGKLTLRQEALESIMSKELRYVGSKYPICSVVRLRKFIARGWRINAGQILKMAMQISELDLESIAVLEDQLTGVDTAYFVQLISSLKAKDPEKVNSGYLIEIIDRLF